MIKFTHDKDSYLKHDGKTVLVRGRMKALVKSYNTETRQGSYDRGLKWSKSKWGLLRRVSDSKLSTDGGKTWWGTLKEARRSKGRVKLSGSLEKEFAFEGIRKIARDWGDGPWRP